MKRHTRIYLDYFGYDESSYIPCELCRQKAVDIHHIDCKGMGGNPSGDKDVIENLQALCRYCHVRYGDKQQYKEHLKAVHLSRMHERKSK